MTIRRILATAAATVLVLAGTAGPARADTTFTSPPGVLYNCAFPGFTQQVSATEEFTGPDTVPAGSTFSITGISGRILFSDNAIRLLAALGYDGVRGSGMIQVTASNATPGSSAAGIIPEQIWPALTGWIDFSGGSESFVAGDPGLVEFGMGTPFSLALQFHRRPNGTWMPWTLSCNVKVTSPAQNRAFSPALPVS